MGVEVFIVDYMDRFFLKVVMAKSTFSLHSSSCYYQCQDAQHEILTVLPFLKVV